MQSSNAPLKFKTPFCATGTKNTIADTFNSSNPGNAAFDTGFPPDTFLPLGSGGIAPDGGDFNGILYDISAISQWMNAGGLFVYDATFSTAIGGYPLGAKLAMASGLGYWVSTKENNTTDPEAGTSTDWAAVWPEHVTSITATATLTAANAGLVLVDATAGNVVLTLPAATFSGLPFRFVRTDATANTVTINRAGTDTIDGSTSISLAVGMTQMEADGASTWRNPINTGLLMPTGSVITFSGATVPTGFLQIPTAPTSISRTTYANLFNLLGTTWGAGDGSTTFGMPYLPADHTIVQANSNLATVTAGELLAHYHTIAGVQLNISPTSGSTYPANSPGTGVTTSTVGGSANLAAGVRFNFAIKY